MHCFKTKQKTGMPVLMYTTQTYVSPQKDTLWSKNSSFHMPTCTFSHLSFPGNWHQPPSLLWHTYLDSPLLLFCFSQPHLFLLCWLYVLVPLFHNPVLGEMRNLRKINPCGQYSEKTLNSLEFNSPEVIIIHAYPKIVFSRTEITKIRNTA